MRTESKELLAVGIFGRKSRIGDRIEMLLRGGRTFSPRASAAGIFTSTVVLGGLMLAGSLAPRWIAFAQQADPPKFEVISIRPCSGGPGGRSGGVKSSPGRLEIHCITLGSVADDFPRPHPAGLRSVCQRAPQSDLVPSADRGRSGMDQFRPLRNRRQSRGRCESRRSTNSSNDERAHDAGGSRRPVQAQDPSRDQGGPGLRAHCVEEWSQTAAVRRGNLHSAGCEDLFGAAGAGPSACL